MTPNKQTEDSPLNEFPPLIKTDLEKEAWAYASKYWKGYEGAAYISYLRGKKSSQPALPDPGRLPTVEECIKFMHDRFYSGKPLAKTDIMTFCQTPIK